MFWISQNTNLIIILKKFRIIIFLVPCNMIWSYVSTALFFKCGYFACCIYYLVSFRKTYMFGSLSKFRIVKYTQLLKQNLLFCYDPGFLTGDTAHIKVITAIHLSHVCIFRDMLATNFYLFRNVLDINRQCL